MSFAPKISALGEGAVLLELGDKIDRDVNLRLHRFKKMLSQERTTGIKECIVAYSSMAVYFDPITVDHQKVILKLRRLLASDLDASPKPQDLVLIPVAYGGSMGPDLGNVASHAGISEEEVIRRHSSRDYHCYMLGFTPGFPYLGGMDESIAAPRLSTPRKAIPAGSVGIAGSQTGIYPIESPGGWQLIGRTPLALFDPSKEEDPTLIKAGDLVRFVPIREDEFQDIAERWRKGTYGPVRIKGGGEVEAAR
ncbi:TIGR00370 family protein [Thermanaerovibrio velox DSM 12556]|uniref:TIGR00370 family protein n=1 Tax=Thermanaerovibrio velox DSM 12556 TaxID=926567 RepID=H0USC3_9BACT|nr:5-oxoprolinase subunit PxpB [Thermanaerovibrio velox]EHM10212.1 TIGR00370 family protein [Thermanaerovibrio velox DSM 12556]